MDSPYRFGRNLQQSFERAGLLNVLETGTVALAAVFPEAPAREAWKWSKARKGPRAQWRRFSPEWVERLLRAMQPRAILVFGKKASESLGIDDEWLDSEHAGHRGRVFARGHVFGSPAVYCHHLSQGWKTHEVARCLDGVKSILKTSQEKYPWCECKPKNTSPDQENSLDTATHAAQA